MELNKYQQKVVTDLVSFLRRWRLCDDAVLAYRAHWDAQGVIGMQRYHDAPHGAPQICAKVPTAGGKTFIGVHAMAAMFDALERRRGKARLSIWLVPSLSIKDQVLDAFRTPGHPYRTSLLNLFDHRVVIQDKEGLLQGGADFNADSVRENVTIAVLTYDSLRARNKDDRKMYQENAALTSFSGIAKAVNADVDQNSLVAALAGLNPIIMVDESHNATSELSLNMLANLNPAVVLELTATPRQSANLISIVDAMALRNEHMVKLPVIVRNFQDQESVIAHAIDLRIRLEAEAASEEKAGGQYIRPIVLFQAETKSRDDATTFEKLKANLLERGIPENCIKIKTADRDELKGIRLHERDCPVRFILTVNALKEGWDCPFAYVLATLADRSSPVDVEQILGRILRQPYVRTHEHEHLNMSYVLTASAVFGQTLEKIVAGLNRAGFSRNDYRTPDAIEESGIADLATVQPPEQQVLRNDMFSPPVSPPVTNQSPIAGQSTPSNFTAGDTSVEATMNYAYQAKGALDEVQHSLGDDYVPTELREKMNSFGIRAEFAEEITQLRLPQFFRKAPAELLFAEDGAVFLEQDQLLGSNFRLADCDVNDFQLALNTGTVAKLDLKTLSNSSIGDYEPTRITLNDHELRSLRDFFATLSPESKRKQLIGMVSSWLGKMPPLNETDLRAYVEKILNRLKPEELDEVLEQQQAYVTVIKNRIKVEMREAAWKQFENWLRFDEIFIRPSYAFPKTISPASARMPDSNSLYIREAKGNSLEERMADFLATCPCIRWWHRNDGYQGEKFHLNGPSSRHFPDFIAKTHSGRILLVETKGDDRDNSDSAMKMKIGRAWENAAKHLQCHYIMVFDSNPVEGAMNWAQATRQIGELR